MSDDSPCAGDFAIGDTVAATADFRIGGELAVERGCRGTVKCHGERPDGSIGVSVQFDSRKDGSDTHVLCKPYQIQVAAMPSQAPQRHEHAPSLELHPRHAWESFRTSSIWLRWLLWLPIQSIFNITNTLAPNKRTAARSTTTEVNESSQRLDDGQQTIRRRKKKDTDKTNKKRDRNQNVVDDFDEALDDALNDMAQQRRPWVVLIGILVLVNVLLAYVHMQRLTRKHNGPVVKVFEDDSYLEHIMAHPDGTLVSFFCETCKPCDKLAPEFEEAARQLQKSTNVSLVSVNAALAPSTVKQPMKLPALLFFRNGRLVRDVSRDMRSAAQIVVFVHESLQPAVIEFRYFADSVLAMPSLRNELSKGRSAPIVVGFGPEPAVHDILEKVAAKFRGKTVFLHDPEARHDFPSIRVYFRDVASDKDYGGSLKTGGRQDYDDLVDWLQPFMVE